MARGRLIAINLAVSIVLAASCAGTRWGNDGPADPSTGARDGKDDSEAQEGDGNSDDDNHTVVLPYQGPSGTASQSFAVA